MYYRPNKKLKPPDFVEDRKNLHDLEVRKVPIGHSKQPLNVMHFICSSRTVKTQEKIFTTHTCHILEYLNR